MSAHCSHDHSHHGHSHDHTIEYDPKNKKLKTALWIALILNMGMFFVEMFYGVVAESLALRADALDFLGDGVNYFVTLYVINSLPKTKAYVSIFKAIFMIGVGLWIFGESAYRFLYETLPDSKTMGWIGFFALVVNIVSALVLYKFRDGDSNMQSVWLCSRNDAIGNVAVMIASFLVYYLNSQWPDVVVAIFMAYLALSASYQIIKIARAELKEVRVKKFKLKDDHKNCSHTHH